MRRVEATFETRPELVPGNPVYSVEDQAFADDLIATVAKATAAKPLRCDNRETKHNNSK